jgi:hypothetical protein
MGGEGQGRTGQEGGYCTFLHLSVGMLGRAKSQYLLGGVVVLLGSTFLCRTCSFHGGRGGKKGTQLYFKIRVKYGHYRMVFMGLPMTKSCSPILHITLKVTSKIHNVFASPLACDFTASKPTCTQKPLVHIAGNHSTGFFPIR